MKFFTDYLLDDPVNAWKNAGKADSVETIRAKVIEGIDQALKQFAAGEMEPKRGLYKVKADRAQVSIRNGRNLVAINGNEKNVVPVDKLVGFYNAVKEAVSKGELDALLTATDTVKPNTGSSGARSASWSPERKAAQALKIQEAWARRRKAAEIAGEAAKKAAGKKEAAKVTEKA